MGTSCSPASHRAEFCFFKPRKAELSYTEPGQHLARGLVAEFLAERPERSLGPLQGNYLFPEAVPLNLPQHGTETALVTPFSLLLTRHHVCELELQVHRGMEL